MVNCRLSCTSQYILETVTVHRTLPCTFYIGEELCGFTRSFYRRVLLSTDIKVTSNYFAITTNAATNNPACRRLRAVGGCHRGIFLQAGLLAQQVKGYFGFSRFCQVSSERQY